MSTGSNDSLLSCGNERENVYAGVVLVFLGGGSALLYAFVIAGMSKLVKKYTSMVFLISMSLADTGFLLLFTLFGFGICFCTPIFGNFSFTLLNVIWNPLVYHYILVAFNRCAVLMYPLQARSLFTFKVNVVVCVLVWIGGIVQQIVFQQWPETYYVFVPESFGFVYLYRISAPWVQTYWNVFNNLGIVLPAVLYSLGFVVNRCVKTSMDNASKMKRKAEMRLAVACAVNSFFLLILNIGTNILSVDSKWDIWRNSVLNMLNSSISAYLLLAFSKETRKAVGLLFDSRTNVMTVSHASSSNMPETKR